MTGRSARPWLLLLGVSLVGLIGALVVSLRLVHVGEHLVVAGVPYWGAVAALVVAAGTGVAGVSLVLRELRAAGDRADRLEATLTALREAEQARDASRVVAEAAALRLRESEERLVLALESVRDGIWDWNVATGDVHYSPSWSAMLGYGEDEIAPVLDSWRALVHPDDLPAAAEALERHLRGESERFESEHRLRARDGGWRWILARGRVVTRAPEGAALRVVGTHTDITERKQTEQRLLEAQKLEATVRLAGGVAHHFNNLLAAIRGSAELQLSEPGLPAEAQAAFSGIVTRVTEATTLTGHMLALSGAQAREPRVVALGAHLRVVTDLLERTLPPAIAVVLDVMPGPDAVLADAAQLEFVIAALANNAVDAMPEGGTLELRTRRVELLAPLVDERGRIPPGQYVTLEVQDNGAGMGPDELREAFEPFYSTRPRGLGAFGLGLPTALGIARLHGGHLTLRSEPGVGTTAIVYWPAAVAALPQAPIRPREAVPAPPPAASEVAQVLVVDDEEPVRRVVRAMLEHDGFQVSTAASPAEALGLLEAGLHVDVMVTDMVMPGMSGRELAERVLEQRPGLRVLYISGYTQAETLEGERPPTQRFLQKPFPMNALLSEVRSLLDTPA